MKSHKSTLFLTPSAGIQLVLLLLSVNPPNKFHVTVSFFGLPAPWSRSLYTRTGLFGKKPMNHRGGSVLSFVFREHNSHCPRVRNNVTQSGLLWEHKVPSLGPGTESPLPLPGLRLTPPPPPPSPDTHTLVQGQE
jgi:hypothetical protein